VIYRLGTSLYHYTTAAKAIEFILASWRLRLGPFSTMRDPRESSDWLMGATVYEAGERESELFGRLFRELNDAKATIKVLSLTRDDTEGELLDDLADSLRFGYGHPRLWEQYADVHTGVCLCLNQEALLRAAERELAVKGRFDHGEMIYRNARGIDRSLLHADLKRVAEVGVEAWVREHLWEHREEFFFRKLGDWSTEMEYRLLLQAEHREPEYVGISDALEAVICGYAIAEGDLSRIRALCGPVGVRVLRVQWPHALPILFPVESENPIAHVDISFPAAPRR
jgi:Protein of unknown function (DUF2971)